jgi:putative nucleotidyltransferase with HDIG domain
MLTTIPRAAAAPPRAPNLKSIPPFRPVALKLMRLIAQDQASFSQVVEVLRTDAVFTGEVMRLANSALMGCAHEIKSPSHAVAVLGLNRFYTLTLTLALRDFAGQRQSSTLSKMFWRHNLASALIAERLAQFSGRPKEECYTAGLLHDIGRIALLRVAKGYPAIVEAAAQPSFDALAWERETCGMDHCEAGRRLLEQWEFPAELQEVAGSHHEPPAVDERRPGIRTLVQISCGLAERSGFAAFESPAAEALADVMAPLREEQRRELLDQFAALSDQVSLQVNAVELSLM